MKALPKLLFALAAAAAFCIVQPAKANLITNPGFETGDFTGWTTSGFEIVIGAVGVFVPHSGNFQAELEGTGTISQTLPTMAGQSYTIDG